MVGSVKRGSAIRKRRVLGGVLFARDGIEKPEDSTGIRTGRQGGDYELISLSILART